MLDIQLSFIHDVITWTIIKNISNQQCSTITERMIRAVVEVTVLYLIHFDPKALAIAVFLSCGPDTGPFLWFYGVLAWFLAMWNLMGTFKYRDKGFPNGGTSCWRPRGWRGAGRGILADFVADLFGDITETLGHQLTPPETLYTPVQEADPAEKHVRVVAQWHDDGDDGGG